MKAHHVIALILALLVIGGLLFWPKTHTPDIAQDELTGRWHAGGTNVDEFEWSMEYEFNNGSYRLTTGTDYHEEGTYRITDRFLDGSIIVEKTFNNGAKVYEVTIITTDNPDILFLEGAQLDRVKE